MRLPLLRVRNISFCLKGESAVLRNQSGMTAFFFFSFVYFSFFFFCNPCRQRYSVSHGIRPKYWFPWIDLFTLVWDLHCYRYKQQIFGRLVLCFFSMVLFSHSSDSWRRRCIFLFVCYGRCSRKMRQSLQKCIVSWPTNPGHSK